MKLSLARNLPLVGLAFGLAGCAPEGEFPSLAMRPAERDLSLEEPVRPPVHVESDEALLRRIAGLRQQAVEGQRRFEAALGHAQSAVAAAGSPRTEAWVEAQQALSRLEESRTATSRALADLDQLRLERAPMPTAEADSATLEAAFASVEQIAAEQQRTFDRLRARLPG